jgi:uncharacterized protein YgbK (DUF1537 family)
MRQRFEAILEKLPPPWPDSLLSRIEASIRSEKQSIVVLDDDPTGTQTVYDLPILTHWDVASLVAELSKKTPTFYILTNSRSQAESTARQLNREIAENLKAASQITGQSFTVVSRSDSTLRGHFPAEVEELTQSQGNDQRILLICPFFKEGGRFTIDDYHYVLEDGYLVPASETPFAQDAVFGYKSSNLKHWIEEKTKGQIRAESIHSLALEAIRRGGPAAVAEKLLSIEPGGTCVLNAVSYRDLEVTVCGIIEAELQGAEFLCRTGASFVRIRSGLEGKGLIDSKTLRLSPEGGGLIVVGSHVPKSSRQLEHLLDNSEVPGIEIDVHKVLTSSGRETEVSRVSKAVESNLSSGRDVVVHTSRKLITGKDKQDNLSISQRISSTLVDIVTRCTAVPRFVIAKGGITSSDLATKAFRVKRAWVLGQIMPGIPVWRFGPESSCPGLPYIVFPGNVGGPAALTSIVDKLGLERKS